MDYTYLNQKKKCRQNGPLLKTFQFIEKCTNTNEENYSVLRPRFLLPCAILYTGLMYPRGVFSPFCTCKRFYTVLKFAKTIEHKIDTLFINTVFFRIVLNSPSFNFAADNEGKSKTGA